MKTKVLSLLSAATLMAVLLASPAMAQDPLQTLKNQYPGLKDYHDEDMIARIYGVPFGSGTDPLATAADFVANHADVYGIQQSSDLVLGGPVYGHPSTVDLFYDPQTSAYKFTLVTYSQVKNGIPCYESNLKLLIRNVPNYPLWLAASTLRDLGTFSVPPGVENTDLEAIVASFQDPAFPELTNTTTPQLVVFAGTGNTLETPQLGIKFAGGDGQQYVQEAYEYVIDLGSPTAILHKHS